MKRAAGDASRHAPMRGRILFLHLLVLWSFAAVQPTLAVLQDSVDFFFPLRRIDGALFVLTLVAATILPPLVLWLIGLIGRSHPDRRMRIHVVEVGVLAALFVAYVLRQIGSVPAALTAVLALVGGILFARAYGRFDGLRSVLTVLAPAPAFFLIAFLGFSNASHLAFPAENDTPSPAAKRPAPVVLLLLDEFPVSSLMTARERIDGSRFPNFARFAQDSTWYRDALAASWTTTSAVPAILTGRRADEDSLPLENDHPENIFALLRRSYTENVIESFTRLCRLSICANESGALGRARSVLSALSLVYASVVVPRSVTGKFPNPGNTWGASLAALDPQRSIDPFDFETADLRLFPGPQFDRFLSLIKRAPADRGKHPFWFLHSNLPHNPYTHLPSGKLYRDHRKEQAGLNTATERWEGDAGAVLAGWQRHLLQVQFADNLLGRLMNRLGSTGLYDDALVVVVADHGASFIAGSNRRIPTGANDADVAMVPLFVKLPRQRRGRTVTAPVSVLDVLPTIADALDVRVPWRVDGLPLRKATEGGKRRFELLANKGRWIDLRPSRLRALRHRTVQIQNAFFGRGNRGPGLYGLGPARTLVGNALASVPRGRALAVDVELDDAGRYGDVDLAGPFVPALVRGRLSGDRARNVLAVAVAVNGRVAGSGYVYGRASPPTFSVVARQDAFRSGRNRVEVFAVDGDGPGARLRPLD